ncbi:MAG: hypothetical protein ABF991_11475 [Liquorilactobacillus hordei]|uniref:hypothetical protein n=1 Tax=Liquorilactobacillus hordei TaxID=468911 RepID=UPI0039EAF28D
MNKRIRWKYEKINFISKGKSKGNPRVSSWHYFSKTKRNKKEYMAEAIRDYRKAFSPAFLVTDKSNTHKHKLWGRLKKEECLLEEKSK